MARYLFWVEVDELPWDVFSQSKAVEASGDSSLDDFFEGVLCMTAKLP